MVNTPFREPGPPPIAMPPATPPGVALALVLSVLHLVGAALLALVMGATALFVGSGIPGEPHTSADVAETIFGGALAFGALIAAAVGGVGLIWATTAVMASRAAKRGARWGWITLYVVFGLGALTKFGVVIATLANHLGPPLGLLVGATLDVTVIVLLARDPGKPAGT